MSLSVFGSLPSRLKLINFFRLKSVPIKGELISSA